MSTRAARLAGAAAAVLAAAVAVWVLHDRGDGYVLRAELADAAGLRRGSDVKVGGVPVGRVTRLDVTPRNTARVELSLDADATPVGRDARVAVRPANLIGEKFVDLDVGDRRRPAPSGSLVPRSRTATPVELDDVIDTLDAPTRLRLGALVRESGIALDGRGADLEKLLRVLPPALDQTGALVDSFARDNRALGRAVEDSERILAAVARERAGLGRLVDEASGSLRAIAVHRRDLGRTATAAAPAMRKLQGTLAELDRTGAQLRPAADGLRASAPGLAETLRALPGFAAAARPTLTTAGNVAGDLDRLGRRAAPVVRRLRPTAASLDRFGADSDDLTRTLDAGTGMLLRILEGWTRAIQTRDGLGHMFRTQLVLNDALVRTLLDTYVRGGTRPHRPATERPDPASAERAPAPREPRPTTPQKTRLPEPVQDVLDAVPALLDKLDGKGDPVRPLLDYLLGPG